VRIPSIAKWLVCIFRSLNEYSTNEEELQKLKNLPVIPLSKGQLVALETSTVFFPLQNEKAAAHMTGESFFIDERFLHFSCMGSRFVLKKINK
jgi:hypothetical protein